MIRTIAGASMLLTLSCTGWGQTVTRLSFEVAAVRPAPAEPTDSYQAGFRAGRASRGLVIEGRRASVTANSLRDLVRIAYGVKEYQVTAPPGVSSQLFDITATLPEAADPARAPDMLRVLLEERFHLKAHSAPKEMPVYVLVAGKGGMKAPKVEEVPGSKAATERWVMVAPPGAGGSSGVGVRRIRIGGAPVARLADSLTRMLDRPVLDLTELEGKYDFDLVFSLPESPSTDAAPSLFTVLQERLGLKLEARKSIVQTVVIDSIDKLPTEN